MAGPTDGLPLVGRTVAITRPDAGRLGRVLAARGATVVHVPLIAIAEPEDRCPLDAAIKRSSGYDWIVVTSANGARAVGPSMADAPGRVAAVGLATAVAFESAAGRAVDLVPADPSAVGLVAEFPAGSGRVLVAQADRAASTVADGLAAKGWAVDVVVAYRTLEAALAHEQRRVLAEADVIVLASASAAESLHHQLGPGPLGRLVAIGPSTAAAVRRIGLPPAAVASGPDADSVARAVAGLVAPTA